MLEVDPKNDREARLFPVRYYQRLADEYNAIYNARNRAILDLLSRNDDRDVDAHPEAVA